MYDVIDEPLRLPAAPPSPARPTIPVAAALVPVVGAVVLWQVTGSMFALWFAALGPLMALAGFADGLRTARRARRRALRASAAALLALGGEVDARHDAERTRAWRRTPDVAGYAADVDEIWRVVPGRGDVVVVGRGSGPSALRVEGAGGAASDGADGHEGATREMRRRATRIDGVPVAVPFAAGIAVCGPPVAAAAVVRALALQACLAHPPGSARLVGEDAGAAAVPHRDATRGLVVFVGTADQPVPEDADLPIIRVAEDAPPPPRCAAVLTLLAGGRARLDHDGSSREVAVEAVSRGQAERLATALAARAATLGHRVDGATLLDELTPVSGGRASLAAAIGVSAGQPVVLDLVADGPHAVVVGVTGSGKSELLTTWMIALCRTRTPQEVALLLVDFKGGRTFDALLGLPHVTGVLTDLDEVRALRAVESLRAEIRHRERVLARAEARDIDEAGDELARLVIVVDEYAALVAARPELHDLFADIAARGRALGMHLVLASQRAAGAFRDGVLANAPLRIAFRVTDAADSRTILGHDDAVRLAGTTGARGVALIRRAADSSPRRARIALCPPDTIGAVRERAASLRLARRPWLPPLPDRIDLDAARALTGASLSGILIGVADEPELQRQPAVTLPVGATGLVVIGGPGSGRTTTLQTVASQARAPIRVPTDPEGAWDAIVGLEAAPRGSVVLIDDADALVSRLGVDHGAAWLAALERACREARAREVTIVVAVTRLTGMLGRVLELLPQRLILPVATRADHVAAGGESADFAPDAPAGRGRWGRTLVQVAVIGFGAGEVGGVGEVLAPAAPVVEHVPGRLLALVLPHGARAERECAAWAHRGVRVREIADITDARSDGLGAEDVEVVVGTPEAWLAQWRLLAVARERGTIVVDTACAAEFRAVTGSRELPPFAAPGAGRAWLVEPGLPTRRVRLPGA
ncbi:FtsK/SpoIIIE domain-containing protein [Microbacterium sp.]|uniref:FtsK/SpoIIIE domain-containing protein n=1 Tax=Microbacterium sp. TaxID=51671 RepID=UPI0025E9A33E|nr:FtsK/SpoIIIE domain-containing protein [Microbacterium sp.]